MAVEHANDVYTAVASWRPFDQWSVGLQLVRAADSVAANIAEAMGRERIPDRRRFLIIARGSLHEAEHWVLMAEDRGLLPPGSTRPVEEIARPLSGLIRRPR
jgi:four helix bundle protein